MSILISNTLIDGKVSDILIEGNKIARIGTVIKDHRVEKVINGEGKMALPGLYNGHGHSGMTYFRGFGRDLSLENWLQEIWKYEPLLTQEDIYWGTKLACIEMIESGTTCFNDMYWMYPALLQAVEETGMRAQLGNCYMDFFDPSKREKKISEIEESFALYRNASSRVRFTLTPHAIYTVSKELYQWMNQFSIDNGITIHTHLAETQTEYNYSVKEFGLSPVRYLHQIGLLSDRLIIAHCLWLDQEEIDLLAEHKVRVIHNPNSNLKLASGYRFKYTEMHQAGIPIAIGTDGAGSSDSLDMIEAMKTAALLQKAHREDPTAFPLQELLDCTTKQAEIFSGFQIGQLKEGYLADIILIDLNRTEMVPAIYPLSNLIYASNGNAVETVICDGKILMEKRVVPQKEEVLKQVSERAYKLFKKPL